MDVYDPQTLGFVVFGGFMLVSALGIALVSTLSMKETSYEEALAEQRRKLAHLRPTTTSPPARAEKKKKNRAKRKEEKPTKVEVHVIEEEEEVVDEDVAVESESEPIVAEEPVSDPIIETVPEPEPQVPEPIPEPTPEPVAAPVHVETPVVSTSTTGKKKKKVAKVEPAVAKPQTPAPETVATLAPVVVEVAVKAAAPAPVVSAVSQAPVAVVKAEEPKAEAPPTKKRGSRKKAEPVVPVEPCPTESPVEVQAGVPAVLSALGKLSEAEISRVMETIGTKASQKGDPIAVLKKQLEDKEKLLAAEQQNSTTAKNRVKELTKELSAEKSRLASVETRLSSELSGRQQELLALQARMQATYQEHLLETQQFTSKIQSLQEQLENGPNAQLARLQQENSILRDALNQATSQAESRQNAEMAKLRQDCVRLSRELNERTDAQQAFEEQRTVLEAKVAVAEEQLTQMQVHAQESERQLQQALEGSSSLSQQLETVTGQLIQLQQQLEQAQIQTSGLTELQERVAATEAELQLKCAELEALRTLQTPPIPEAAAEEPATTTTEVEEVQVSTEEEQSLEEEVQVIEEEPQEQEEIVVVVAEVPAVEEQKEETAEMEPQATMESQAQVDNQAEVEELKTSLQQKDAELSSVSEELLKLKEELELLKAQPAPIPETLLNGVDVDQSAEEIAEEPEAEPAVVTCVPDLTAEIEQLQSSLQEKDQLLASLQEQLEHMRIEMKTKEDVVEAIEAEQPFENLEEEARIISLEEEQKRLKEQIEQMNNKCNELEEQNRTSAETFAAAKLQGDERLTQAQDSLAAAEKQFVVFQSEVQSALQTLFSQVTLETEQSNWLEIFMTKAHEILQAAPPSGEIQEQQEAPSSSELPEMLSKLQEAEESQRILKAECDQYRTVLGETEGMLKQLQKSVEEEEQVWKAKITQAEEQKQAALDQVKALEEATEGRAESQSTEQLKEQVMLLEAQLEKQLESVSSSQTYAEEIAQLKASLSESQMKLDAAHAETQKQTAELASVRQELKEATERLPNEDSSCSSGSEVTQVQSQLDETTSKLQTEETMKEQLAESYEQAQRLVTELEAQLDSLKSEGDGPTAELKERLEKEKKLTRDLGQAATKLQQLLKTTQEQLAKERETIRNLQEQTPTPDPAPSQEDVEPTEAQEPKEGTSV